jgi:hypothetical protein
VEEALALAGRMLGPTSPRWERLEAICQEFLGGRAAWPGALGDEKAGATARPGAIAAEPDVGTAAEIHAGAGTPVEPRWASSGGVSAEGDPSAPWRAGAAPQRSAVPDPDSPYQALRVMCEEELGWGLLHRAEPIAAPGSPEAAEALAEAASPTDLPFLLDAELRHLAQVRERWDELVGHLALLLQSLGLWRDMGFASFANYCAERLGLGYRTVEQRAALERKLYELPELRQALREGRVSYEKARLVARAACVTWTPAPERARAWIARAEATTCVALRREVEAALDAACR